MLTHPAAVVAVLLVISPALGFNANDFKKCQDLSFCRRNRALPETRASSGPFFIVPDSLQVSTTEVSGRIHNAEETVPAEFVFSLRVLANPEGVVQFIVDEANEDSKRFVPPFVLEEQSIRASELSVTKDMETLQATSGDVSVKATFSPLKIEVWRGERLVVIINERNLFNFEHYRPKPEAPEPGLWEERFNSHTDSKPKGPASIGVDFSFVGASHVYGIPEHATSLALKPTRGEGAYAEPYRLYNLDVFEYDLNSSFGLYGSVPFMLSVAKFGSSGVFLMNTSEMYIDVYPTTDIRGQTSTSTHWYAESGRMDIYIMTGPSPKDVLDQYTTLTGRPMLPSLFSLAYHQCRWNYKDHTDVINVDSTFDQHDISYDVLWLDIEHTDGKKYFTWDTLAFPDPVATQNALAHKARRMVTIVDPHIKRDSGYGLHSKATAEGLYVKSSSGDFEGKCWPGQSSYMDFLNDKARDAYSEQYEQYPGATKWLHTWNDMNEPSVFDGPEITMPKDAKHHGGVEHRDVHNLYGMLHHMASHQGLVRRLEGHRPFILTRSFFSGSQRYAGVWTGDNMAKWEHLDAAQPMLLSLSVAGIPFVGADVGGFFFNTEQELFVRWYQAGAYHPFFRAHAHIDTKRREPWLFGEPTTSLVREAVRSRYRLLPYWYTVARETNATGVPMMRPLWFEFTEDEATYTIENQFMVGSAVLVKPVVAPGVTETEVYLPGGPSQRWFDFLTGAPYSSGRVVVPAPLSKIPVFQKAGTIVPKRERIRRSSSLMARDPFTLVIALNAKGEAYGELYLDDGETFGFKSGEYLHRSFTFSANRLTSSNLALPSASFPFADQLSIERLVIRGFETPPSRIIRQTPGLSDQLSFVVDATGEVVVRKPGLGLVDTWFVRFG